MCSSSEFQRVLCNNKALYFAGPLNESQSLGFAQQAGNVELFECAMIAANLNRERCRLNGYLGREQLDHRSFALERSLLIDQLSRGERLPSRIQGRSDCKGFAMYALQILTTQPFVRTQDAYSQGRSLQSCYVTLNNGIPTQGPLLTAAQIKCSVNSA